MTTLAAPARHRTASAVAAIVWREWRVFRRVWHAPTFGALLEPLWYLVVFGYGLGALITEAAGIPYLDFMATGAAANAVLATGLMGGAINGFFRRTGEQTYEGVLSTTADVADIVTGEAVWIGIRAAAVTVTTLVVAAAFGVELRPAAVLAPLIGFVSGFGFACMGLAIGGRLTSDQQFEVVTAVAFAPMFVMSSTFFPLESAPAWLRVPALLSPLTHVVALLRAAVLDATGETTVLVHALVLVGFVVLAWLAGVRSLRSALVV